MTPIVWGIFGFGAGVLFTGILMAATGPKISGRWDAKGPKNDPYRPAFRIDDQGRSWIRSNDYDEWRTAEWQG